MSTVLAAAAARLRGRRVLVIGAGGFLGGHLAARLVHCGALVHACARTPPQNQAGAEWHVVDVRTLESVEAAVDRCRPEVVFHLAAHGTTARDPDPAMCHAVNVGGVEHLWSALERSGSNARLVQLGTCGEYGPASGALNESSPCHPQSAYTSTIHEAVTRSQQRALQTGREAVLIRPFGPYGPGDRPERLIPHTILMLLAGDSVDLTQGEQNRDFSYVSDHLDALCLAATTPLRETGRIFNIGSGGPVRAREVVETIADVVGVPRDRLRFGAIPYRPSDAYDMFADIRRARLELGFEPQVPLCAGIAMTVAAYRQKLTGPAA